MTPPEWYGEWAESHRGLFDLPPDWVDTGVTWWPAFQSLAARPNELAEATRDVQLADTPPRFLGDHLPAVKAALGRLRNRAADRARRQLGDYAERHGVCIQCADTTWVTVPHPEFVRNGEWVPDRYSESGDPVFVTSAVTCTCRAGVLANQSIRAWAEERGKRPPQALGEYERVTNPAWRDHIAEHAAARETRSNVDRPWAHQKAEILAGIGRSANEG